MTSEWALPPLSPLPVCIIILWGKDSKCLHWINISYWSEQQEFSRFTRCAVFVLFWVIFFYHFDTFHLHFTFFMCRGYNIGQRLIEEFLARSGLGRCKDLKETSERIAKVGFKMFLGENEMSMNWLWTILSFYKLILSNVLKKWMFLLNMYFIVLSL